MKLKYFKHHGWRIIIPESLPYFTPNPEVYAWVEDLGAVRIADVVRTLTYFFPEPDGTVMKNRASPAFWWLQTFRHMPYWKYTVIKQHSNEGLVILHRSVDINKQKVPKEVFQVQIGFGWFENGKFAEQIPVQAGATIFEYEASSPGDWKMVYPVRSKDNTIEMELRVLQGLFEGRYLRANPKGRSYRMEGRTADGEKLAISYKWEPEPTAELSPFEAD